MVSSVSYCGLLCVVGMFVFGIHLVAGNVDKHFVTC